MTSQARNGSKWTSGAAVRTSTAQCPHHLSQQSQEVREYLLNLRDQPAAARADGLFALRRNLPSLTTLAIGCPLIIAIAGEYCRAQGGGRGTHSCEAARPLQAPDERGFENPREATALNA